MVFAFRKPLSDLVPILGCWLIASCVLIPTAVLADDVTGSELMLCSPGLAVVCEAHGECASGPAWTVNMPDFVRVDLRNKRIATTETSTIRRSTPIEYVEREAGRVVAQGHEQGRAWTLIVAEADGSFTFTISQADDAVIAFGACTPIER